MPTVRPRRAHLPFLFLFLLLAVAAAPGGVSPPPRAFAPATDVSGVIDVDTTWDLAGSPYLLDGVVTVAAGVTLTVEPGVWVQGWIPEELVILGHLQANGTAAQPVVFTSDSDAGVAQWKGIRFDGGTGSLTHARVSHAAQPHGGGASAGIHVANSSGGVILDQVTVDDNGQHVGAAAGVRVENSVLTVSNSIFVNNGTYNGSHENGGGLVATGASTVTVSDTTFEATEGHGILAAGDMLLTDVVFQDSELSGLKTSAENWQQASGISFVNDEGHLTGGTFAENMVFPTAWGATYYGMDSVQVTVPAGVTLTLEPGFTLRASQDGVQGGFIINGHLLALGTAANPILLTDYDDSGLFQWRGFDFDGGTGEFHHVTMRRGGQNQQAGIVVRNSPTGVTLDHTTVNANGTRAGAWIIDSRFSATNSAFTNNGQYLGGSNDGRGGIVASGASTVTVQASIFDGNEAQGIYAGGVLDISDSTFTNSELNGLKLIDAVVTIACGNFLDNGEDGIEVDGEESELTVNGSTFNGNGVYGLHYVDGQQPLATYNYWGDPSGPGGEGPGSGDAIEGTVAYAPWLTAPECLAPVSGLQATNDGPTVETLPTQLTAAGSGTGVTYTWDLGDGTTAQGAAVTHVYPAAGDYTAVVTATNSVGSATAGTLVTILPRPTFGGTIWEDLDGDGQPGAGEPPLAGAAVSATGPGGTLQATSGADGGYTLETEIAGSYTLTAALAGYQPTTPNPLLLALAPDGSAPADFGLRQAPAPGTGSIAGRAWVDGDGDGQVDDGETLFENLPLALWSDGSAVSPSTAGAGGLFQFADLAPGVYEVRANAPAGFFPASLSSGELVVVAGETVFAPLPFGQGGTVTGVVEDAQGGVADVLLQLEQPEGTVIAAASTGSGGAYQLGPVSPGTYTLRLLPPPNSTTPDGVVTRQIVVADDQSTVENWFLDTPGTLSVSAQSWFYPNQYPVAGLVVNIEGTGGYAAKKATSYAGKIFLQGLPAGSYTVTPVASLLPANTLVDPASRTVTVSDNSAAQANFDIEPAQSVVVYCRRNDSATPPFGPAFPCIIEVRVVEDEAGTPPGTLIATVQPSQSRHFFYNLPEGSYEVSIVPDPSVTGQAEWPVAQEIVLLSAGTHALVRYPFNPTYGSQTIRGFAFWDKDLDGNRDSLNGQAQSNDEANRSQSNGLTVELADENGVTVATTVTAQHPQSKAGWFEFADVTPGTYQVRILLPDGYGAAGPTTVWRTVDLTQPVEQILFPYTLFYGASVDGWVFYDQDGDGAFSTEIDAPVSGATVTLRALDGSELSTTETAGGYYTFYPFFSGSYLVELTPPAGSEGATTLVQPVAVPNGGSARVDYPLPPADGKPRVLAFVDSDLDGVPGPDEQRVGGVALYWEPFPCGAGCVPSGFKFTDSSGIATFNAPFDQTGRVKAVEGSLPAGTTPAAKGGVPLYAGSSGPIWLRLVPPGTLTVRPFWDADGDQVRDAGEPNLPGIEVEVAGVGAAHTSNNGASFPVSAGIYDVTLNAPPELEVTVAEPQAVPVPVNSATVLEVPLRYDGTIGGQVTTPEGGATFSGLQVELFNPTTLESRTAAVSGANNTFQFSNVPAGTYRLRLPQIPAGYVLQGEPIVVYTPGSAVAQNLVLLPLGDVHGQAFVDDNGNGVRDGGEDGTNSFDIFLLSSDDDPVSIPVAADGTFLIIDLDPNQQYALTSDLDYAGIGPPGAIVTAAPGWFAVDYQNVDVAIGILPWDPIDPNFNLVLGEVYLDGDENAPVAGAEIGYFHWDDDSGCSAANPPILGSAFSDVSGQYALETNFLPGQNYYCIRVIAPGYLEQSNTRVVKANYTYQSPGGPVIQPRSDSGIDLDVESAGGGRLGGGARVFFGAFGDANGNGVPDPGEPPLFGVTLAGSGASATTGLDGRGTVAGLGDGEHLLTVTPPAGYVLTDSVQRTIWLSGADLALPPLAFQPAGYLQGAIFVDADGDGAQGAGERGLGAVTVTLSGPVVTHTVSAPGGHIALDGLPDGIYQVQAAPAGFSALIAQSVTITGGTGTVSIGVQALDQVSGVVYDDWDGDGRRGPGEEPVTLPVTVTLGSIGEGRLSAGQLLFWQVPDGTYTVSPAWTAVAPVSVTVGSGTAAAAALPAVEPGLIRGTLWHDASGDGVRQPWETPLSGVTITLDGVATAITGRDGRFFFAGVGDGQHTLGAALPAGLQLVPLTVSTGERGAAVGLPAVRRDGHQLFLPLLAR